MQAKVKAVGASQALVVTASRLRDGRVVWLADGGAWTEQPRSARVFVGTAIDAGLAEATGAEQAQLIVDAYAVAVTPDADGPWPLSVRERIRAGGPSILAGIAA